MNSDDREKKVFYELGRAEPTYTVDTAIGAGSSNATVSSVLGHLEGLPPPPYVGRDLIMTSGIPLHGITYTTGSGSMSPGSASAAASFMQMAGVGSNGGSGSTNMSYYMSQMGIQQQQQQLQQQHQHQHQHLSAPSPFGHPLQYGGSGSGHLSLEHSIPPPPPPGIAMPGLQSVSTGHGGYGVADQVSGIRNSANGYWYPPNTTDSRFSS